MNVMAPLGAMHAASFEADPKHLGFVLARYKFVAKMLCGAPCVLEVGCGEGTGAKIVRPHVGYLLGIDIDEELLPSARIPVRRHDILDGPVASARPWNAAYALDVLEHIKPDDEDRFFANICATLAPDGTVIIGSPSLESQPYASELSKLHHVNCKTEDGLRGTLQRHFRNVYLFGMNDEVLHTGFGPMCHYRLAVCVAPKEPGLKGQP